MFFGWPPALTLAGPVLRAPYGLVGPARGPAGFRSASRARGAAAERPCPGARPAPRHYALRARGPGSVLCSAPLACAAPPPWVPPRRAARAPTLRIPGLCAWSALRLPWLPSASSGVRVGPLGVTGPVASPSAGWLPSSARGAGGGRDPPSGAPAGWPVAVGTEGDHAPPSESSLRVLVVQCSRPIVTIPAGTNRCGRMELLRQTHCVLAGRASASRDRDGSYASKTILLIILHIIPELLLTAASIACRCLRRSPSQLCRCQRPQSQLTAAPRRPGSPHLFVPGLG